MFNKVFKAYLEKFKFKSHPIFGFGTELNAIRHGIAILNDIHKRENKDYQKHKDSSQIFQKKYRDRKLRFLANYTAYLNTLYNLEKILERSYQKLTETLNHLGLNSVFENTEIENRRNEIANFTKFRHKVFGHASFGLPKEDSDSIQSASILYFNGDLHCGTYWGTGGSGCNVNGKCEILPKISIIQDHKTNLEHYQKWEDMFINLLKIVNKIDIS